MLNNFRVLGAVGPLMLIASSAAACPFCDSETSERVREGIFNADFGYHLAASFAPFPILIGVLVLIYYWPVQTLRRT